MDRLDLLGPFLAPPQNPRNHVVARNPHLRSLNSQVCIFLRKTQQVCIVGEIETGRTAAGRVASGLLGFVVSETAGEQTEWKLVSIVLSICRAMFHLFSVYFTYSRAYKSSILSSANIQDIYCEKLLFLEKGTLPKRKKYSFLAAIATTL